MEEYVHGCGSFQENTAVRMDSDEPSIVFDLGSQAIKAGFAGNDDPCASVPSVLGTSKFGKDKLPVSWAYNNIIWFVA